MTQSELKKLYADTLAKDVWRDNQHMVDYCVAKTAHIVHLQDGCIIAIDKPRIEKDFCFGYSLSCYDSESYDDANSMANHAATDKDYFMQKNLSDIENTISLLIGTEPDGRRFCTVTPYCGQPKTSLLKDIVRIDYNDKVQPNATPLSSSDRSAILDGYQVVRAAFIKRLNTYLKRYGLSKVKTWTYWRDE